MLEHIDDRQFRNTKFGKVTQTAFDFFNAFQRPGSEANLGELPANISASEKDFKVARVSKSKKILTKDF